MKSNAKRLNAAAIATPVICMLFTGLVLIIGPTAAADDRGMPAMGAFTAEVDFSTLAFTPVGTRKCLLTVKGALDITGALDGVAVGTTRTIVFGHCPEVAATPPGTFADAFRSKLRFSGTLNGVPAKADMTYQGVTNVGGEIQAYFLLSNGLDGSLNVTAFVAQGGKYEGLIEPEENGD